MADPRVIVAPEDARAYVRRHPDTFDVIFPLSTNTFAALAWWWYHHCGRSPAA